MRFAFLSEYSLGEDAAFHYSIVEQSLENGKLSSDNNLVNCYEGIKNFHPIGYYISHYFAAKLIGLDNSFKLMPIIFAVFNILLAFYLINYIFNKRVAYISAFLIAVSVANISKSAAQTFRGENLIYPFLLLSLIFGLKFLEEKDSKKKLYFSVLAGFFSGISSFIWSGYVLVIIILTASICLYLLYNFIKTNTNNKNLKFVALAFLIQFIIVKIISYFFINPERNIFGRTYYLYLIIIPLAFYLIILKIFEKYPKNKIYLFISLIIGAIIVFFQESFRITILNKIRIARIISPFANKEAKPTTLPSYFLYYGFLLITSFFGLIILLKNLNRKKIYFIGLLIPSVFLLANAMRFIYFASIPLLILSAVFLDWFLAKKQIKLHMILFIIFLILILMSNIFIARYQFLPLFDQDLTESLAFIEKSTAKNSCIIGSIQLRGLIPYLSKRSSYYAAHNTDKEEKVINFLFTNSSQNFNLSNSYILIQEEDIYYLTKLVNFYNITGLDASLYLGRISNTSGDGYTESTYQDLFDKSLFLTKEYNNRTDAFGLEQESIFEDYKYYPLQDVYKGDKHYRFIGASNKDCFYMGNYTSMYFNDKLCNSNIVKIMTWQNITGLEKFHRNNRVRIYRIIS